MITVHELGHYVAGKIFKFKINEFAIGMGPAVFKRTNKKTGEVFSVRVFPLGGFCAFEGEDEDSENADAFNKKEPWKRIIVLIAGATMNFILGVLVLMIGVGVYGQTAIETYDIKPTDSAVINENSLHTDDVILKIDNHTIYMATDITSALKGKSAGDEVKITVKDANGNKQVRTVILRNAPTSENLTDVIPSFTALGVSTIQKVTPTEVSQLKDGDFILKLNDGGDYENCSVVYSEDELISYAKNQSVSADKIEFWVRRTNISNDGETVYDKVLISVDVIDDMSNYSDQAVLSWLGIKNTDTYLKYATKNIKFSFFESVSRGFGYSLSVGGTIFRTLGELLTGKLGISAMGGPITTITATSESIRLGGLQYLLEIAGFIGVNLAVFNLLPIPALDGSRVVFCVIEWIRKKPVNRKVEAVIHAVGLMVLLGFSILVDIFQLL